MVFLMISRGFFFMHGCRIYADINAGNKDSLGLWRCSIPGPLTVAKELGTDYIYPALSPFCFSGLNHTLLFHWH